MFKQWPKFNITILVQYFFYLFIIILPFQTHYIISNNVKPFAIVSVYAYDIIFFGLLMVFIYYWYNQTNLKINWPILWLLLSSFVLVGCSAYWANDRAVSAYYWLHFGEALLILAIVASAVISLIKILHVIVFTGLIQTGFIIWQYLTQTVISNSWLGMAQQLPETTGTPVVLTSIGRFLRSFGTFPHPNTAAGWLILCLGCGLLLWHLTNNAYTHRYLMVCTLLTTVGLLFTFSRAALLIWCAVCLYIIIVRRSYSIVLVLLSLCLIIILSLIYLPLFQSRLQAQNYIEQLSLQERQAQTTQAYTIIKQHWVEGVGIGNYTLIPNKIISQPVHLTLLLLASELGVFTTIIILWLVGLALKIAWQATPINFGLRLLLIIILLLSCFDHYFWTLPSMLILAGIIIGLIFQHNKSLIY